MIIRQPPFNRGASHFSLKYTYLTIILAAILIVSGMAATPLHSANLKPHYDFNANCIRAYNEIFALRFDEGKRIIAAERKQNPSNKIPVLLENYIDFLELFLSDDPLLYKQLEPNQSVRLNLLSEVAHESPWQLFAQAAINFQWSFTRARFGEFAAAALDLTRAYNLIERNKTLYPDFYPNHLISGVLKVVLGAMPDQYRWLTGLVGMSGSVEYGRSLLNTLVQHIQTNNQWSFLKIETLIYLSFIEISLMGEENEPERIAAMLAGELPQNNHPLICYVRANTALRVHRNDEAMAILSSCIFRPGTHPLPHLDLLRGVAYLNRLNPAAADFFHAYTQTYKTRSFVKTAFERLAWIKWLEADTAGFQRYMGKVLTSGKDVADEDKIAQAQALSLRFPNRGLLRARLLFDGGYFDKALENLDEVSKNNSLYSLRDSVEFHYRRARILHQQNETNAAIIEYLNTISLGKNTPWFFAANAALHVAMILEQRGHYASARNYYNQILSMPFTEYRTGITKRAKAGLARISKNR